MKPHPDRMRNRMKRPEQSHMTSYGAVAIYFNGSIYSAVTSMAECCVSERKNNSDETRVC